MYLPDMTVLINDVQRSVLKIEDRHVLCSAVQAYYKQMQAIGATNQKIVDIGKDSSVLVTLIKSKISAYTLGELETFAKFLDVPVKEGMTKADIIEEINRGE